MESSLRLFLSLADPANAGIKRECPFASPSPSPETTIFLPSSPPLTPYPFLSNYATAGSSQSLLDKPRAPPPRPIPLDFPQYAPNIIPSPLTRRSMRDLRRAILSARRPTDNTDVVFDFLNVQLTGDVPLDSPDLVPADFLPERPFLYDTDLESMLAELSIENEDAFREVLRQKPKEGRPKPRIAYSRNFFGSLEDMSHYSDSSKDSYYEVDVDDDEDETTDKPMQNNESSSISTSKVDAQGDTEMSSSNFPPPAASTAATSSGQSNLTPGSTTPKKKKTKPLYTGIRLGASPQLPPSTRTSLIRNLLKMVLHKFTCRDYDLSPRERLRLRDINIPPALAAPSFIIARLPSDRALARARHVEGPVMGVSVRHEVVFDEGLWKKLVEEEGRDRGDIGELLGPGVDLIREVASALSVAVMRGREGRNREEEAERLTKEWWWAREKRWGGGELRWGMFANEVFEEEDPSWSPVERELQRKKRERSQEEMKKVDKMVVRVEGGLNVQDLLAKSEKMAQPEAGAQSRTEISVSTKDAEQPSATVGLLSKSSKSIPTLTPTLPANSGPNTGSPASNDTMAADRSSLPATNTNNSTAGNTDSNSSSSAPDRPPKKKHRLAEGLPEHLLSSTSAFSSASSLSLFSSSKSSSASSSPYSSSRPQQPPPGGSAEQRSREEKRERDMHERAEFREGRRLMYTAPMRRKWFREWANVRPNGGAGAGALGWGDEKIIWRGIGRPRGSGEEEEGEVASDLGNQKPSVFSGLAATTTTGNAAAETAGTAGTDGKKADKADKAKNLDSEYDEIYQLSCLNHHVALLKVRVSKRYLRWLENGDPDAEAPLLMPTVRPWVGAGGSGGKGVGVGEGDVGESESGSESESDVLKVWRTKYYDLFDLQQRKEFFVALWRVLSWLCREEVAGVEWGKVEEARVKMREEKAQAAGEKEAGELEVELRKEGSASASA